jgi:hypothetical protein
MIEEARVIRFILVALLALGCVLAACTPNAKTNGTPPPTYPRHHQISMRLQYQWDLTKKNLHEGKISPQTAEAIRHSIKSVQLQQVIDYKNNPDRELTLDQQKDLNSMLDMNSQILEEIPTPIQ